MTDIAPLMFIWDGEGMVPMRPFRKRADQVFVIGERYRLEVHEERSDRSHSHYFASIAEVWANLPDDQAARWPTPEHLRKWALIRAGYSDQRQIVCGTKAEAQRMRAFIAPIDDYAIVTANEAVVTVFTAKSQSYKAMGKKEFGESKQKVLDILADLIGVKPEELTRARAA